jgi:hypothetical protein
MQLQKCFGVGPAGMPDLSPCLLVVRSVSNIHFTPLIGAIRLTPICAVPVSSRPPTPPPRAI